MEHTEGCGLAEAHRDAQTKQPFIFIHGQADGLLITCVGIIIKIPPSSPPPKIGRALVGRKRLREIQEVPAVM